MKISAITNTGFSGVINIPTEDFNNKRETVAINTCAISYIKENKNGTTIKYYTGEFDRKNGGFFPDIPQKEFYVDTPVDINTVLNAYNAAKISNLYINLNR